jgi:hypothetical protein
MVRSAPNNAFGIIGSNVRRKASGVPREEPPREELDAQSGSVGGTHFAWHRLEWHAAVYSAPPPFRKKEC